MLLAVYIAGDIMVVENLKNCKVMDVRQNASLILLYVVVRVWNERSLMYNDDPGMMMD